MVANTVALAAGGHTAARLPGTSDDTDGVLYGLAVWAIALLVSAAPLGGMVAGLVSPAASTASSAVSSAVGGAVGGVAPMVSAAEGQTNPSAAMDRATDTPRGTGGEARQMSAEQRAAEMSSLLAGRAARGRGSFTGEERARLDALVAAEAGLSAVEAGRRVQAVKADAQRTATEAPRRAREAADAGARATFIGVLGTCAALPLGAIAAVLGSPGHPRPGGEAAGSDGGAASGLSGGAAQGDRAASRTRRLGRAARDSPRSIPGDGPRTARSMVPLARAGRAG